MIRAEPITWHSPAIDDDYTDFVAVRHPLSEHVALFALAASSGRLTHVILLADEVFVLRFELL